MKAAFYDGNQTIRIGASTPRDPGPGSVRIRVSQCGICGTGLHIFHGHICASADLSSGNGQTMKILIGAGQEAQL